ncbi:hypothetical protein LINGRAHAP2_LOCUS20284 [Linum grandiflorum]
MIDLEEEASMEEDMSFIYCNLTISTSSDAFEPDGQIDIACDAEGAGPGAVQLLDLDLNVVPEFEVYEAAYEALGGMHCRGFDPNIVADLEDDIAALDPPRTCRHIGPADKHEWQKLWFKSLDRVRQ